MAIEIADKLFNIADKLRGSGLIMSNNIAEGSGSHSKKVFRRYLDIAKNSTSENANVVIVLNRRELIETVEMNKLLEDLDYLSRKITNFKKTL